MRWVAMGLVCAGVSCASVAQDAARESRVAVAVIEDGRREVIVGVPQGESVDGLSIRVEPSGELDVVPWVEIVERPGMTTDAGAIYSVPTAWRDVHERSRVGALRAGVGDLRGAADAFRGLAPGLLGSGSRQANTVFSVLLRDAALRGDTRDACVAMLALDLAGLRRGFDARHDLHPDAPLVEGVEGGGELFTLLRDHEGWDERSRAIIALRDALDDGSEFEDAMELAARSGGGIGLELCVKLCVAQAHPDAGERAEARDWLRSRASSMDGTWIDAWARLALAGSHAAEGDDESVSRALIELSHAIVRFGVDDAVLKIAITMARRIAREHDRVEALEALDRAYHRALTSPIADTGTD